VHEANKLYAKEILKNQTYLELYRSYSSGDEELLDEIGYFYRVGKFFNRELYHWDFRYNQLFQLNKAIALKRDGYDCTRCTVIRRLKLDYLNNLKAEGGNPLASKRWSSIRTPAILDIKLEVHHKLKLPDLKTWKRMNSQTQSGYHSVKNLVTLCSKCHSTTHEEMLGA
jgi:5-methylcytosine-specific restriction endonuclease McrA